MKNIENMLIVLMVLCLAFVGLGAILILVSDNEVNPTVANDQTMIGFIFIIAGFLALIIRVFLSKRLKMKNPEIAKQFKLKQTSTIPVS